MIRDGAIDEMPQTLYTQLIQAALGKLEVRVVKGPGYRDPEDTDAMVNRLRQQLGDMDIEVRFCGVEDLERNPIGKIRYAYNKLSNKDLPPGTSRNLGITIDPSAHTREDK